MVDIEEIKTALSNKAEDVVNFLYPTAIKEGNNYRIGDVYGAEGKSFHIAVTGPHAGLAKDFAGEEVENGEDFGDLIDCWSAKNNSSLSETLTEIREFLGLEQPKKQKKVEPVIIPSTFFNVPYDTNGFLASRQIPKKVVENNRIIASKSHFFGKDCYRKAIGFPHYNGRDNESVYMVQYRSIEDKRFISSPNGTSCLYGWHTIPDRPGTVYITEGHMDKLAVETLGYHSLSLPFGGGKGAKHQWIDSDLHRILEIDELIFILDPDKTGIQSERDIAQRIGAHKVKFMSLPDKDPNDFLEVRASQGVSIEDMRAEWELCKSNARWIKDDSNVTASDIHDRLVAYEISKLDRDSNLVATPIDEVDPSNFSNKIQVKAMLGEFVMIQGKTGTGKSQFANWIQASLLDQGHPTFCLSPELSGEETLSRLVCQLSSMSSLNVDPHRWSKQMTDRHKKTKECTDWLTSKGFRIYDNYKNIRSDKLWDLLDENMKRYGIRDMFIDNRMVIESKDNTFDKQLAQDAREWCRDRNARIWLVMHERKPANGFSQKSTGYEAAGSSDWYNACGLCCVLDRNRVKEEAAKAINGAQDWSRVNPILFATVTEYSEKKIDRIKEKNHNPSLWLGKLPDTTLRISKDRNFGNEGSYGLRFDPRNYRFDTMWGSWKGKFLV